jgi:hypothetical protein
MSHLTYSSGKPIVWLRGEVKTPPFSKEARIEAGCLLRLLQRGEMLGLPHSRPMPVIGPRCHELRINDAAATFRIIYRTDPRCCGHPRGLHQNDDEDANTRD